MAIFGQTSPSAFSRPALPSMTASFGTPMPPLRKVDDRLPPARDALLPRQAKVQNHTAAVLANTHRDQHWNSRPPLAQPHPRIPAVKKEIDHLLSRQIPTPPRLEVLRQPPHQPRHRILRQRSSPKQRRQRSLDPPRVGPRQIQPQNRLVHTSRPSLISRQNLAAPLLCCFPLEDPRPRHRKTRRP